MLAHQAKPGPQVSPAVPEGGREVRLGLVMYGGVSLAIYINGVSQEFYRAVRGRGVYGLIKALTDSEIVVDIISGTSAGGINGIFLAYALCNEYEFAGLADLWREHADINRLLRDPEEEQVSSLLDSEGYYQKHLEGAFEAMRKSPARSDDELASCTRELDLFVTGTDAHGVVSVRFDSAGQPIEVKDHRTVFQLKYRAGRKNEFAPSESTNKSNDKPWPVLVRALAKLARTTSCFPVAFAPVCVDPEKGAPEDRLLGRWGRLKRRAYFLDGGVLDNKPFTHTIFEIFHRTATCEVERMLLYVEPDPETFGAQPATTEPNLLQVAFGATVGIPGYESISGDLKLIADRNNRIRQFQEITSRCRESVPAENPAARKLLDDLFASGKSLEPALSFINETARSIYFRSRLISVRTPAIYGLLRTGAAREELSSEQEERVSQLVAGFNGWKGDGFDTLDHFDVFFRKRRLFSVIYEIYAQLYPRPAAPRETRPKAPPQQVRERYQELWGEFNQQVDRIDILRHAIFDLMDGMPMPATAQADAAPVWANLKRCLEHLLHASGELREPEKLPLARLHSLLQERVKSILRAQLDAPPAPVPAFENLLFRLDKFERAQVAEFAAPQQHDPVYLAYSDFILSDAALYPLELCSGVLEKDIIRTYRISPLNATAAFSDQTVANKVAGDQLAHFSGFFKRSWRCNDILYGRLDAAAQLIEQLFSPERVRDVLDDLDARPLPARYFAPHWQERLAKQFPGVPAHLLAEVTDWVNQMRAGKAAAFDPERFAAMRRSLIGVVQLQILSEELPCVLQAAVQEQHEWRRLNPTVASLSALADAQRQIASLKETDSSARHAMETRIGRYFRSADYSVGRETIKEHIPALVLLETLSKALLVFKNNVLSMLGEKADQVRDSSLYRFGLDYPLRAFHGWVSFLRHEPRMELAVLTAAFTGALLMLVLSATFASELLQRSDGQWITERVLWCVAVPVLVVMGVVRVLLRSTTAFVVFALLSVGALAVAWKEWDALIHPGSGFSYPWALALVGLPILVLVMEARYLFRHARSPVPIVAATAVALMVLAGSLTWRDSLLYPGHALSWPGVASLVALPLFVLTAGVRRLIQKRKMAKRPLP